MINAQRNEQFNKTQINIGLEQVIRKKLSNLPANENDIVYTLGIGISYPEMIRLMSVYDGSDDTEDDNPIYFVTGSDERVQASGIVFVGADQERMFFGLLGDEPTQKPHPLEDVNGISDNQKWCLGRIEFDTDNPEGNQGDAGLSLIRSFICYCQQQ